MAPFSPPDVVLTGFKERAESLTVHGDKLYVGTATGNLHVYSIDEHLKETQQPATLVETKKSLSRRAIEQLAYVPDIASLAVLSDAIVTLYPLPGFAPATPLVRTKTALSFALFTTIEREEIDLSLPPSGTRTPNIKGVPIVITYLAVGCRRKVVLYSWKDGEPQEPQETVLPHSPRTMEFINRNTICFGYSPTDYVLYSLESKATTEISSPTSAAPITTGISTMGMGMGAFSGLGGYIGLSAKAKPCVLRISDSEGLIAKDNNGICFAEDGKPSRPTNIDWPAPPEDIAFIKPYIFTILPPGSVPLSHIEGSTTLTGASSFIPSSVVEIRSSISLGTSQTLTLPFHNPAPNAPPASLNHSARLLAPSPSYKSPIFLVSTPIDRTTATNEGSSIWSFRMKSWGEQVDELVEAGSYSDALALLENVDSAVLPDKEFRQRTVRALNAVSQFKLAHFPDAINAFLGLNINPAKVAALYPESISGRLSVLEDEWIPLFGGPAKRAKSDTASLEQEHSVLEAGESKSGDSSSETQTDPFPRPPSPVGSVRSLIRTRLDAVRPAGKKDDESASIRVKKKDFEFRKSIEELMRYLSDRRPKVAGALEALGITTAQAHEMPALSAASVEDLFKLPDAPLSQLTPEELVRFAQIVDTALFKSYLLVRPGLLAPLCRVGNWCEVSEVEEVLRAREKFSELIYLYNGKKMHNKALDLLKHLAEKETDMRDKLMPIVNYLQRLGPEHLDHIFEYSRWVFEQDHDIAFEIFTSEEVELPKQEVADFLDSINPAICARYVEYLINERGEESASFHNRLAELYMKMTLSAKKRGDNVTRQAMKEKFLHFIDTTNHYQVDRLFGLLPQEDLFEAKAILLGRLGRHDSALEIYVYRLQDFLKAEEYCKRVYQPNTETKNVFLTLLRIYLRPTVRTNIDLLTPALDLISRHSPRLDEIETLQILPPLVTAKDVKAFLVEALRAPVFDTRVIRDMSKARDEQVARRLMHYQSKRVKVTDSRICPQCHKRIGHSVIAVHAPRGEVTHYQCREAFAKKLKETRG